MQLCGSNHGLHLQHEFSNQKKIFLIGIVAHPRMGAPQEQPTRGAERAGNSTKLQCSGSVYLINVWFVELNEII